MALPRYIYTPLDRSARQIRLLQFVQLDEGGISCTLETYDIASCPPFVAMSYTWGIDASPRSEILLNGAAFRVRQNLGEMLASMRERLRLGGDKFLDSIRVMNSDRPWKIDEVGGNIKRQCVLRNCFWIDAICVNQEDLLERGHQVGMMKDVFSDADFVISWLGPDIPGVVGPAFDALTGKRDPPGTTTSPGPDVLPFYERPYWGRMWIIQEFILPRKLFVLWGSEGVWWGDMFRSNLSSSWPSVPGFEKVRVLCFTKHHLHLRHEAGESASGVGYFIDSLIERFYDGLCADPRDRVYSLLGLVDEPNKGGLQADYTLSPMQLYCRVLRHVLCDPPLNMPTWEAFRGKLPKALGVDEDGEYPRIELVYKITEPFRLPCTAPVEYEARAALIATHVVRLLGTQCIIPNGEEPQKICEYVMNRFNGLLREEDLDTWEWFERIVEEMAKFRTGSI